MTKSQSSSAIIILIQLIFAGCAQNLQMSSPIVTYQGTSTQLTFQNKAFTLKGSPTDAAFKAEGTAYVTDSGLIRFDVTSASGAGAPAAGTVTYGIGIPGVFFVVRPFDGGTQQMWPMLSAGCPQVDAALNWVEMDVTHGIGVEMFGTYQFDLLTSQASFPRRFDLNRNDSGSAALGSISCSGGVATLPSASVITSRFGGSLVAPTPATGSLRLSIPQETVPLSALNGTYSGIIYSTSLINAAVTFSNGTMTYRSIKPETVQPDGVVPVTTINGFAANSPSDGFFSGSFSTDPNRKVTCAVTLDAIHDGRSILLCVGGDTSSSDRYFAAVLTSL